VRAIICLFFLLNPGKEAEERAKKTIHTMRWALIQIAGKPVRQGRGLTLKLATACEKYSLYLYMRQRCVAPVWAISRDRFRNT
jgi:hypothetical protein